MSSHPDTPLLESGNLLERVRLELANLSAAERKVAELVLAQPYTVMQEAVGEIARRAGVSQPTVIRFCRSLGVSGLSEFKLKLAASLMPGVPYVHATVRPDDAMTDIAAKVFDNTVAALIGCRNQVDPASVEAAVEVLNGARRVEFYGLGNSGITAADAQHKFFRFGLPTVSYNDPHVQAMAATLLGEGDVVVAISNTGRTVDLIEAVTLAHDNGATVIAITKPHSPLAECADLVLAADVPEDADTYSPMLSRLVHLVLIDVLAVGVALKRGPELIPQLERVKRSLTRKRLRQPPLTD